MSRTKLTISLEGLNIGLSGAVPDRDNWSEPAMDRAVLEFVAFFTGVVFKYGGRIVHGAHPTFTPVILRQARRHTSRTTGGRPVTLIMSDLWAKDLPSDFADTIADVAEFVVTKRIGDGGPDNVETRNRSLTEMRRALIERQDVMVAVGGKMHDKDRAIPGIREEMEMAATKRIPRFLVGGMGGYAARYAKDLQPSSLYNGLSQEKNHFLLNTTDVSACVNTVLEGILALQAAPRSSHCRVARRSHRASGVNSHG
jgi:hypothetical protein